MQGRDKQVKKKELYSYVFWGVLSTILNIGLAQLVVWSGIDYKISNAITLVIVKVFCYFTNKIFVFKTPLLNYILSKKMVFHKQRENGVADESIQ